MFKYKYRDFFGPVIENPIQFNAKFEPGGVHMSSSDVFKHIYSQCR